MDELSSIENNSLRYHDRHMENIEKRFTLGMKTYKHGVRVMDDTRQWDTVNNSWLEMAEEEILDALIYTAAAIVRKEYKQKGATKNYERTQDCDNQEIKCILKSVGEYRIIDKLWKIYNIINNEEE